MGGCFGTGGCYCICACRELCFHSCLIFRKISQRVSDLAAESTLSTRNQPLDFVNELNLGFPPFVVCLFVFIPIGIVLQCMCYLESTDIQEKPRERATKTVLNSDVTCAQWWQGRAHSDGLTMK